MNNETKKRVALGVSGGIAAYKVVEVLRGLQKANCDVRVCMTKRACEFVTPLTFRALSNSHVIVDDYSPDNPDPIAHITFSQSADLLLVAPATANIIAKFANGIADDFLSTTYLASNAPVLIAPAMNTTMLLHPATQRNLQRLKEDGVKIVEPDEGEMACKTIGPGRLSEPEKIVAVALEMLQSFSTKQDLKGERILITTGATREEIDPVRFISNHSSGKMGFALAQSAALRGADVTLVAGATSVNPPSGIRLIRAISAQEMFDVVMSEIKNATAYISAAAVADYRPALREENKIKKTDDEMTIALEKTKDILAEVGKTKHDKLLVVGFAAETNDVIAHAKSKLEKKNLDAIVANDIAKSGAGFNADTNIITIITRDKEPISLPMMTKSEAAHRVLDEIVRLRNQP